MQCLITLEGQPPFSLYCVFPDGTDLHTDLNSFRPDPRRFCKPGKKYRGRCYFEIANLVNGQTYNNLRRVIINIDGVEHAYARVR